MRTQLTRLVAMAVMVAMLVLALMMSATGAFAAHGERHGEGGRIVGEGLRGGAGGGGTDAPCPQSPTGGEETVGGRGGIFGDGTGGRGFGNGCGGGSG